MLTTGLNCILAAAGLFLLMAGLAPAASAQAQSGLQEDRLSSVIFVYHRIDDDDDPSANISADQFKEQVRELQSGGYNVMPLPKIVNALKSHDILPKDSIGITFDGGHKSIMTQAVPLLLKNNMPFTIFIAPSQLDQNLPDYMGWADIKRLSRNKLVTIGMHPADYKRLTGVAPSEIAREVNSAKARFREQLGIEPALFAYPFGEYSIAYRSIVEQNGFAAAFGQQSGVAWPGSDIFALPRFSMTENYGDIDRFRMIADSLPLPVTGIEPQDPHLTTAKPDIGFTIDPRLKTQIASLSCFVSDQEPPAIHVIGDSRVEIRLKQPLEDKARVNCTMPAPSMAGDEAPHWRWFGLLLTGPGAS